MECNSLNFNDIGLECKDVMGGLKTIYIVDYSKVGGVAIDSETETITGITLASGSTFSKWEFRKQTSSMTSTATIDDAVGSCYFQTDVALQFSKLEKVKRLQIMSATIGNVAVIVKDFNDKLFYLGFDNPVTATSVVAQSGVNYNELNGYQITLSDMSKSLPMEIDMNQSDLAELGID